MCMRCGGSIHIFCVSVFCRQTFCVCWERERVAYEDLCRTYFSVCSVESLRKWKRNYADTMVIYSLCTARRVLFSVETIRLSGCFRVCVCSRKCFFHRLKNEKRISRTSVLRASRSSAPTFMCGFYWSSNCTDSNECYYLTASWMKPKSRWVHIQMEL